MNIGKVPRKPLIHECDFDSGLVNGNWNEIDKAEHELFFKDTFFEYH